MGGSKTISGALHRIPNLEHNNRDHWPPNATHDREDRNRFFINGTRQFTIEKVYKKLFESSYQEWREKEIKKSRGDRCPDTYYEKIQKDKQKHVLYEIIWQIGDMEDTGYNTNYIDSLKAEQLLIDFAMHMLKEVPNVTYITKERLEDTEWEPPFEEGIVISNFAFNGDESTPHLHMSFIPYVKNCSRGQSVQNAFSQAFKRMGYATTMKQAVDDADNLVWQETPKGKVPQMKKVEFGAVNWIEEQKEWIAHRMIKEFGWERFFKGKNERGDLLLSDYRRERAAEKAKAAECDLEKKEEELENTSEKVKAIEKKVDEVNYTLELTKQLKLLKESEVATYSHMLEATKQEYKKAKDDYLELEEKTRLVEEISNYYSDCGNEREQKLFDTVVELKYENQQLKAENQILRNKLNQAYDFMKQFVIGGVNLLEKFLERIGEKVQQMVGGVRR